MVTFLNFNFLLFFILFFPLSYFFSSKYTFLSSPSSFFSSFFFFSPPHTYSSSLIYPQPHLLTFNHFLFFLLFYLFITFSPHLLLHFSTVLYLFLCPTKATPLGPPPHLYQPLVHGFFFFLVQRKKLQKKPFWP